MNTLHDEQGYDQILVFGSRKETTDFLYRDEWLLGMDKHLKLLTAFSQDQNHKVYVQQVLSKEDNELFIAHHILEHKGAVYIAGGAKMSRAVNQEIIECLAEVMGGGVSDERALISAKRILKKMNKLGTYRIEAWN